jgi:hypothetical protein
MLLRLKNGLILLGAILVVGLMQAVCYEPSEPFFNNDETRHVMTGVFFRDLFLDLPVDRPRDYTVDYYLQYPALGLLVWPPFFYAVEGLFMLVFGTSLLVAKVLVGLFAAVSCTYLYKLVARTHDLPTAVVAVLLFGFAPLVFALTRQVMLELPTLTCALAATYHFLRYLEEQRRRDLVWCSLATCLTLLTRFDGMYLAPLFLILLVARKRLDLLRRGEVLLAALGTLVVILPFYGLTALEFGWAHVKTIEADATGSSVRFLGWENLYFYPSCLPGQVGWFALVPALLGLVSAVHPARRKRSWPYLAMAAATYVTFSPPAELQSRHAIYWVPAFALLAADGLALLCGWLAVPRLRLPLAALVIGGTAWLACKDPAPFVRGYEEAARYVVAHTERSPVCLFDNFLNGNFIYQVRRHDPDRRLWVLRGDKVFYSVLCDPHVGYQEWAKGKDDLLALIFRYDPELIVVEEPQVYHPLPLAAVLRAALREHPERFRLETVIPVDSNHPLFQGVSLEVYRNLLRNERQERRLEVEMLGLRRSIQAMIRPKGGE